ncbi:AMP-binding protein [Bradyrhizobium sp. UNPF46]|uniref:AMP-binding protein n=1 Tax=Bradyrhizobium sp. UNPF46 TaxID=1141168 RepID=UPI001175BE5D|nr:AMP-binding protein [Bradyrhizobium sp. UNPF46]TQF34856.1 AMP-binding protein [Bradyrhizobium sp. UNPF46]
MTDVRNPNGSWFRGDRSTKLIESTISSALDETIARFPNALALVVRHQGIRLTYEQLGRRVDSVAAGFWKLGLRPGERIGIWAPNCVEWTLTQYAAAKIGLILVNLNPAYRANEIGYALAKVGCKALVCAHTFKDNRYVEILRSLVPELAGPASRELRSSALPGLKSLICTSSDEFEGVHRFSDVEETGRSALTEGFDAWPTELRASDPINIQFTSGTTGAPKAATLSHRGLLNSAWFTGEICQVRSHDTICMPLPLFHIFGMLTGNLLSMLRGATIVYPNEAFLADDVLQAVEEENCTYLYGVPTMFIAELASLETRPRDLSSLRGGIIAGSVVPMELLRRIMAEMNMSGVVNGYGMTETSSAIMVTSPADTPTRRVTSVGRVVPHMEAKIVDPAGAVVAIGEPGEIHVRGYGTMLGYWEDPEATARTIDEGGWLRTGDIGSFDEHGYGRIVGRLKEMVIRGGENISCGEIEDFLAGHPSISGVQVVGVPDPKYGEELCACVILKAGAEMSVEALRAYCKSNIAHYKVPRYVRFVQSFPLTASGKVQKFVLASASAQELGLAPPGT